MGFGKGIRLNKSIAKSDDRAKRKVAADESLEQLCKRQKVEIDDMRRQLDEAIEQRDLATKQRDEAQTEIPDIMMKASVDHIYIFLIF